VIHGRGEEEHVFGVYAGFYDALYADKDYEAECDFVADVLREAGLSPGARILDLGCGTGGHALPLARRGFQVTGVDRSPEMIAQAIEKTGAAGEAVDFRVADIRDLDLGARFDAVLAMFAVVSYQLADEDLADTFASARRHLERGGLFLFDVWHGPAVLAERPEVRVKSVASPDEGTITRVARPTLDPEHRTVRVDYEITVTEGGLERTSHEAHTVRYLFVDEIEALLASAGLTLVACGPFMDLSRPPSETDWNVSVLATAL
jgi:SAM-dependent methyltransferase